ncbi:efflux RND transporter periplasmic adaptor subunit [Shimia aestuarii]|uniref:efflux RND transporter periplasmic adaptor subunit n=1 Tax=Shimia aestuarii TaxID=254406 RepID=UPI001FB40372|nr:HlyD family efflux transporter periplasmic adaptor subunit [Shimia aestuarii]
MRFLRQSLTGVFLAAVIAGVLIFAVQILVGAISESMAKDSRAPQGRERILTVQVQEAVPRQITPHLIAFGEVQSRRSLELRARTGGIIVDLSESFVEGGAVEEGEFLVQVDPTRPQYALDRVRNDLLDAEAEQRDAERALALARDELAAAEDQAALRQKALARQTDLQDRDVGTAAAVETAELALSSARQAVVTRRQAIASAEARIDQATTQIERARIALAEAERTLADTEIRADFAGMLADVNVVEGGLVSANEMLATLIDADALEVAFRVSTPQYARLIDDAGVLRPAEVSVRLDVMGGDLVADGVISREGAVVGDGQTGRQIFARLNAPGGLRPGDFVTVRVEEAPLEGAVELSASALDATGRVLVVGEGERLEALPVTLLRRQGDRILVTGEGLAGRQVVARLTPLLGPGIRVKPLSLDAVQTEAAAPETQELIDLSDADRARLVAFVEGNAKMPKQMKERLLAALAEPRVPAGLVQRIESRMGG